MVRARALVPFLPIALAMLVLSLLTRPPVSAPDDLVTIATVDAWLRGETTIDYEPASPVPSRRVAGALVYDRGDGLRAVRTPTFAVIASPLIALGHVIARTPLALREGTIPPIRDPRVALYGALAPLLVAIFVTLFVAAARELVRPPSQDDPEKPAADRRRRSVCVALATIAAPALVIGPSAGPSLAATSAMMFALYGTVVRETRAGALSKGVPWACGLAIAICPEQIFLAIPIGVAFYLNERSWRRSPSRAMARFVVPIVVGLAILFVGDPLVSAGGWSPLHMIEEAPAGALAILLIAPVLLVGLLGLPSLARRSASLAFVGIGIPLAALVMYGGWRTPTEGDLLTAIGPIGLALVCLVERHRAAVIVGASLSLFSAAIAVHAIASRGTWMSG